MEEEFDSVHVENDKSIDSDELDIVILPEYNEKSQRPKLKKRFRSFLFFVFSLLLVLFILFSSVLKVRNFVVRGNNDLSDQEVINILGFSDNMSILETFKVDTNTLLESSAIIETVNVTRDINMNVYIDIKESTPLFLTSCYYLSNYECIGQDRVYIVPVMLNSEGLEDNIKVFADELMVFRSEAIDVFYQIEYMYYEPIPSNNKRVVLKMVDGNIVAINYDDFASVLNNYFKILDQFYNTHVPANIFIDLTNNMSITILS